jgi:hypothetical protein
VASVLVLVLIALHVITGWTYLHMLHAAWD